VLVNYIAGLAIAWQVEPTEHGGGSRRGQWRGYFSLSGPTDSDASGPQPVGLGKVFESVPVAIATRLASQRCRRTDRLPPDRTPCHRDNSALPVVFNDYMNTLKATRPRIVMLPF